MVAIKAHQAAAFLKSPDAKLSSFLFYGADPGMVSERARLLAKSLVARDDPPGEIIRIGDSDLEQDPDRLIIELQTMPMFGGRQAVRVAASRRITALALKPVIEGNTPPASFLIVEAANLKPTDALRKLFEKSPSSAAIACFADNARDLGGLIDDIVRAAGLDITRDARTLLISKLGADHALSRGEIEKLTLYALGTKTIEVADVDAVVGDASELATDRIILAAAAGNSAMAVRECDRSIASGTSAQLIILSALRHFQRLHKARTAMDAGRSIDDVMRSMRPPIHFKQKDAFTAQARSWSAAKLTQALTRINEISKAARLSAALEAILAERLLLELARLAKAGGRGQ